MVPVRRHRASAPSPDQEGSVSIIAVAAAFALVATAALSVDAGTFFLAKRKQQAATDIAATAAVQHLDQAQQVAQQELAANGFDPGTLQLVEFGSYQADPRLAPAQRFQVVDPSQANAVRVTIKSTAPMYFGAALLPAAAASSPSPAPGIPVRTQATAAAADFASFAIGSQLASLDGGLLNKVMGGLLGANLSLSVMDYQALASAQLDVFTFSNLLATRLGLQDISYGQLAATSIRFGDLLPALSDAVRAAGGSAAATAALVQLSTASFPGASAIPLGALLGFGPFSAVVVGSVTPVSAKLTALDAITMMAEVAGEGRLVTLNLSGIFPGLTSATLQLAVGAPPAGSSFVVFGRSGAQVRTAQTRLLLVAGLPALSPLLTLQVPLYVQLASATATLSSLSCGPQNGTPTALLGVQPSLADAWIGSVPAASLSDFGRSPVVQSAPIASVLGVPGIYGQAEVAVGNATSTPVSFSAADIAGEVKHRTTTTDFTSNLLESLTGNLQLSLTPTGSLPPLPPVSQAVVQNLGRVAPTIDQVLGNVLAALGLELGNADTWITGVRCGGGVLVN